MVLARNSPIFRFRIHWISHVDRVNAIQLWLGKGAKSVDAQIDYIGTLGPVVQTLPSSRNRRA